MNIDHPNQEDPQTEITIHQLDQLISRETTHLYLLDAEDHRFEIMDNQEAQRPNLANTGTIAVDDIFIFQINTPAAFDSAIEKYALIMARKLSVLAQLLKQLKELKQHRLDNTYPRHIMTSTPDNERLSLAIENMRKAKLNLETHCIYFKLQAVHDETHGILNQLRDTLIAMNDALMISEEYAPHRATFLEPDHFNATSMFHSFILSVHNTVAKFSMKRHEDEKKATAKREKFLADKAIKDQKNAQPITLKTLTDHLKRKKIDQLTRNKPAKKAQPVTKIAATGSKKSKAKKKQNKSNAVSGSSQTKDQNKGKGKKKGQKGKGRSRD